MYHKSPIRRAFFIFKSKFSPVGGTVAIRLRRTLGSVIISIANDGNLLTEEQTAHIFDKFYQGDKSRAESGYGLGLAIVKRIVELHGGTVSAKNTGTSKLELCVELPQRLPQQ